MTPRWNGSMISLLKERSGIKSECQTTSLKEPFRQCGRKQEQSPPQAIKSLNTLSYLNKQKWIVLNSFLHKSSQKRSICSTLHIISKNTNWMTMGGLLIHWWRLVKTRCLNSMRDRLKRCLDLSIPIARKQLVKRSWEKNWLVWRSFHKVFMFKTLNQSALNSKSSQ